MTNKLPVVGKRYKHKITKDIYKAFKHKARENCYFMENQSQGWDLVIPLHDFFIEFEELPEDKAETKLETQSHISELSDEVKEAMRELKQEQLRVLPTSGFYNSGVRWHSCYNDLCNKTKNLLNALDKEFSLNGHFEGLPPSKEAIERNKMQEKELYDLKNMASGVSCKADYTRKEEVKEKEFFWAAVGQLIEYQGKKYICINQTNYLPNEKAEDWKEEDHTSQWCKHTKIRFRDIFANNKTQAELILHGDFYPRSINFSGEEGDCLRLDTEDLGKDILEEDKEQSIWKPVSELPDRFADEVLIKHTDGQIRQGYLTKYGVTYFSGHSSQRLDTIKKYCTLTDYINNIEQRLRKLENK